MAFQSHYTLKLHDANKMTKSCFFVLYYLQTSLQGRWHSEVEEEIFEAVY